MYHIRLAMFVAKADLKAVTELVAHRGEQRWQHVHSSSSSSSSMMRKLRSTSIVTCGEGEATRDESLARNRFQ